MDHVVNQSLESDDYNEIDSMDYPTFQSMCMNKLGLNPDKSTGLFTSACMDNYGISTLEYEQLRVTSIVTAGADKNGTKAGDPASFYEYNNKYDLLNGTINIICLIDANLDDGALVTASITLTEAKTSLLEDLKLESQYSTNIATGTGTDGLAIISNKSSPNHLENAGKHSKLGELIAKTVYDATLDAIKLQTAMCPQYQKTILSRLTRFNIDFKQLYEKTDNISINDYATLFYPYNNDTDNIAWLSMIINLIDEYQTGLLEFNEIIRPIKRSINEYTGYNVNDKLSSLEEIIDELVCAINYDILKNR
ncbi:MAG: adenosylcobinamide amidohydrolase [Methanosphaera sp.]|nr:adenosylcobinamide amidohydrolase [Methanosphaera sp.]